MRTTVFGLLLLGLIIAPLVHAAEQTVLGRALTVKAPAGGNPKRKVVAVAKESGSPDSLVGDPTLAGSAGGALLEVLLDGANPSAQEFLLAQGLDTKGKPYWSAVGTIGFQYKDPRGEQGPVKIAQIKLTATGAFTMKAVIEGKNGPVDVVPPNPGTSGCMALRLGAGDRYSVQFADGDIKNSPVLFKVSKPTTEGVCPTVVEPTTTSTSTTSSSSSSTSTTTSTSSTSSTTTTTSTTTSTSTSSSTSTSTSSSTSSTSTSTSSTLPPLPAKISVAGDCISQGLAADCTSGGIGGALCLAAADKPQYSWFNGTSPSVNSVHDRYLALNASILSERESVSGAEMRGGGDSFAAQAARILTQTPVPDHVEVLLGGNDICNRDCVNPLNCGDPVYTDAQWRTAVRAGLDPLVAGLPLGSTVYLIGIPRVQDLREVGLLKTGTTCNTQWSTFSICRIVTNGGVLNGEDYATRRAGVGERQQRYNEILREEAEAYTANTTGQNPRGIEVITDYVDEVTPSVGTTPFVPDDIDWADCFHPSIAGQDKIAGGVWASGPHGP